MKRLIALSVFLVFGSVAYADYDMSEASKQKYRDWLKTSGAWHSAATDAALAVAPNGCWAAESGVTRSKAKYKALKFCKNYCKSNACKVVDFNGTSAFINIYHPGSSSSSSTASTVETLYRQPKDKYVEGDKRWFKDGDETIHVKYVGETKDGVPHGTGTETVSFDRGKGQKYVGQFKDGKRHGQGAMTWASGSKHVGQFKDDKRWQGVEYLASGGIWGTYSNGKKCKGCYPTARQLAIVRAIDPSLIAATSETLQIGGGTYIGDVVDGRANGQGTLTWPNGNKYIGEWKDGKRHGQGTLTLADGDKYVGEFKDNKLHGQGTLTLADGDKYVGEFKDDKPWEGVSYLASGEIAATYSNGKLCRDCTPTAEQLAIVRAIDPSLIAATSETLQIGGGTYIGDVVDGRANGQGTLTWPNGSKYVGEFKDSKHHGQGTYTFPDGYKYVGEWKDGKQHGQGTYTTAGGNKYVGEKTDGKKHGQGTYTFADGRKYVGEWKDSKKHGQGTYTYADGQKYVGEWKDGYRHGKGTYTFADGDKYVGEFKNEKPWEGVSYLASGEIAATFSNGEVCRDCTPTAEQLAIVGEISATPITTPLAQPVGAQDKALSGDASPVIATLEELQDELEMAEKIELANELARGGAKNNDYSEQNKTASTPLTDPFLLAQSSYQVYKHTNDNDALSLAFASIHIAMEADQDNYKVFFLAGLIANEMPNKIIASQLAAVYFERASMLNLNDAPLHYIIAQNLYTKNRARESLEYFERALLLENRFLTPEYILILSQAYIQAGQASRGATFFDAYRKNRSNLRLPAYLISTAAYLQFADQIRIILADASYSIKDKERAMKMLEGASH